ncbi:MAG: GspE/PulE family protein [Veillonellaceae bacterium]|nr:GspE/PulE family protein [Veillonellaceae bacterium]
MTELNLPVAGSTAAWVDEMLSRAVAAGASDVHWEPQADGLRVRWRVHGRLREVLRANSTRAAAVVGRIKAMAQMDIAEKRLPADGSCHITVGENSYDVRISTLPTLYGEKVVMRILGNPIRHPSLAELGLTAEQERLLRREIGHAYGLVAVGGATGTGKSTTLYATIRELHTDERNLVTIEDPVEYRLDGVSQVQVNEKAGLDFSTGLRAVLRQDPDVIMVGEIRDEETAEIAVRAALSGHLVLTTVHANEAAEIPLRFLEMGVPSYLLAASLRLCISQRLVRLLCPNCAARRESPEGEERRTAVGCEVCDGAGYSGRTAIFSFLPVSERIRHSLADNDRAALRRYCREETQGCLDAQTEALAKCGRIDWRELAEVDG